MDIEYNRRGLLTAFFRQQRKFLAVFAVIVLAALLHILTTTPIYEAQGSFLVKFGQNARPQVASPDNDKAVTFRMATAPK